MRLCSVILIPTRCPNGRGGNEMKGYVMLSNAIQSALNDEINLELQSAYVYFSMAAWFERENLPGCAHWMELQYGEEQGHAKRIYKYVNDQGARVVLQALKAPPKDFGSVVKAFEKALEHEKAVSASIHEKYEAALKEKDFATQSALQWFVNEQVEEEKQVIDILNLLSMVGESKVGLVMLDKQLGSRGK